MIDPKIVETLVHARAHASQSPLQELTAREREVLGEIAQGKSNTAIAGSLFLTKRAVEKHINAIFLKLGLTDAHDASKRVKATLMLLAEIARGKSNTAIAESLFLSKRAVEKHINAIFLTLGLTDAQDASKRVKATLMLLSETGVRTYS
jgi:DNA-binding NarL/FixJ family response regulator